MLEDTQNDISENQSSIEDQHLELQLKIEEKKYYYRIERRPLIWYGSIIGVTLLTIGIGSITVGILGSSSYFGGMASVIATLSGMIFIGLLIGFFSRCHGWA